MFNSFGMKEQLRLFLKGIAPLVEEEEEEILSAFKPMILAKQDYFLRSGKINRYVGFLNKGLVRYFVLKDGEESTFEFTAEGDFVADYQSFNSKKASTQSIQAIEDCEFLVITYEDVQRIFTTTEHGNLIGRLIVEHRFDVMVRQLLAIYMQSHEERYKSFIANYADLAQRIPQYMIASYVGVKAPSLSRIRRRFAQDIS